MNGTFHSFQRPCGREQVRNQMRRRRPTGVGPLASRPRNPEPPPALIRPHIHNPLVRVLEISAAVARAAAGGAARENSDSSLRPCREEGRAADVKSDLVTGGPAPVQGAQQSIACRALLGFDRRPATRLGDCSELPRAAAAQTGAGRRQRVRCRACALSLFTLSRFLPRKRHRRSAPPLP